MMDADLWGDAQKPKNSISLSWRACLWDSKWTIRADLNGKDLVYIYAFGSEEQAQRRAEEIQRNYPDTQTLSRHKTSDIIFWVGKKDFIAQTWPFKQGMYILGIPISEGSSIQVRRTEPVTLAKEDKGALLAKMMKLSPAERLALLRQLSK